ncbi:MAG: DUF2232 domain-containing protein [Clostridia bacterium]|nr:DUF2232 domain-containing protein [Clostridia bacterium]
MSFFGSFSKKRVILFSVLSVFVGLTSFMSLSFAPYLLLTPVLLCLLYAGGGLLPVLIGSVVSCSTFSFFGGFMGALLAFLALVLPALLTVAAIVQKVQYPTQLRVSVAGHVGGTLLMLVLASALTGGQLISMLVETVRYTVSAMPENFQDALLILQYPELSPSGALITLASDVRAAHMEDFFQQLNNQLSLQALPQLMQSSLLSAGLASYLPARALYRRGELPDAAFQPLSRFHLSGQVTIGLLLTTLTGYLLNTVGVAGADTAFITLYVILEMIFTAQGLAAMDRMLCASHRKTVYRVLLIGAVWLFIPDLVAVIGLCSALFGRQGLLRKLQKGGPTNPNR